MTAQQPLDEYTCHQAWARLYEYLDKELDRSEESAVRRHLDLCDECLDRFHFEGRLIDQIRTKCRSVRAPADLRRRIENLVARL